MTGSLAFDKGCWKLQALPHVAIRLKRLFPQIEERSHGTLSITDSPDVARDLEWFLDRHPLTCSANDMAILQRRSLEHRERSTVLDALLAGTVDARAFTLAKPARDYQRVGADLAIRFKGLLLADDMGLGKTVTAITMLSAPETRPALVATLTHLPEQWQDELKKFAPHLRTTILQSTTPYDLTVPYGSDPRIAALPGVARLPDVILAGYTKLAGWADHLAPIVRSVVWDEAQELRHPDSQKAEAARKLAASATYRLGLSGTPIYNYGDEIFNVLECIRPGELGSRAEFLREWCKAEDSKGRASIAVPAAFGSFARESGLMLRRTRSEVGRELPPIQRVPHPIECDTDKLDDIASAAGELARIIMSQNPEGRGDKFRAAEELSALVRMATGIAKAPYVAEFVRMILDSGERVLLYGWHWSVYDIWLDRLKEFNPVMFTGSETANQKRLAKKAFCDGESPLLIMSLRAGAGIDGLQHHCRTLVFGELDWSPGVHEQDECRIFRDGQKDPVVSYYPLASDGSDPIVADILGVKREQIRGIRDPNAELIEKLEPTSDHVKKLAERYLAKRTQQRTKSGTVVKLRDRRAQT